MWASRVLFCLKAPSIRGLKNEIVSSAGPSDCLNSFDVFLATLLYCASSPILNNSILLEKKRWFGPECRHLKNMRLRASLFKSPTSGHVLALHIKDTPLHRDCKVYKQSYKTSTWSLLVRALANKDKSVLSLLVGTVG